MQKISVSDKKQIKCLLLIGYQDTGTLCYISASRRQCIMNEQVSINSNTDTHNTYHSKSADIIM